MKKIISAENSGERIDKFLVKEFFSYTRGEIIRSIWDELVLVNGKKIKPSYILKKDDELEINLEKNIKEIVANNNVLFKIIFEDENMIVIDKPANLTVHPVTLKDKNTLVNGLLAKFPEIRWIGDGSQFSELRPGIVHRLDKNTTGIMIVARNKKAFNELKKIFQDRKISKKYLAVVYGKFENKSGLIEKPLGRSRNYKKQIIPNVGSDTKTRTAVTEYSVFKKTGNYSLVEVSPKTGRMHQIRVHLASLGHPVVGDEKYGKDNLGRKKERQLLHSKSLEFELFGKKYYFEASLPRDFSDFLKNQCGVDDSEIKG